MNVKDIKAEEDRHLAKMVELLAQLKDRILSLPDNPRIQRLSNNCFTMSSKNIGNNWSAEYHDHKKQYQLIVNELETAEPTKLYSKLQKLITDEKVIVGSKQCGVRGSYTVNLHPDVVAWLRKTSDMSPKNCPSCLGEREWAGVGIQAICHFCGKT